MIQVAAPLYIPLTLNPTPDQHETIILVQLCRELGGEAHHSRDISILWNSSNEGTRLDNIFKY